MRTVEWVDISICRFESMNKGRRTEATEQRAGPLPSMPQLQSPSQNTAGAPNVYTGDTATGGSTPRRRYISISSVARLPPREWPCRTQVPYVRR